MSRIDRTAFVALFSAGLLGVLALLPYLFALVPPTEGVSLTVIAAAAVVQLGAIVAVSCLVGLYLGPKVGLGAPLLRARLNGHPVADELRGTVRVAVPLGVAAAVVIVVLDVAFGAAGVSIPAGSVEQPELWKRALASLYGGITEELLVRFGLMTLLVWLSTFVVGEDGPADGAVWAAIVVTALAFGAGHLGTLASITDPTPLLVVRTVLLNAVGGIVFGWLYWRRGIEAAMAAHLTADLTLHVVAAELLAVAVGG
ncbi:CPBP family intramembrane metalloprotease [Natronomonas halophila]|uniref:CPBP family intramembrane glutamic endopeptidase n=1 Tax=Natronomonas halophila TaxID=2747817 RepID=UPI0015B4D134|nr:CPBP family intramembrane glutamic endopeptidase [Natronomonas halophila]QLD85208.1 CPBP family intramembrane metalloprotease [Natronomonas halophila]